MLNGVILKTFLNKLLKFLNLTDRANNLSITNIALIILLVKLAIMPTLALPDVAAFFIVLLNYGHKRMESNKAAKEEAILTNSAVLDLKEELASTKKAFDSFQANQAEELAKLNNLAATIAKQAEDTKKVISTQVVQQAFTPRNRRNQE